MKQQKIIIADGSLFFREGLKNVLLNIGNTEIVGEVENGKQLLNLLADQGADIVFLDVVMPEMDGFEATWMGHHLYPGTRFIAFSSFDEPLYIDKMIHAGVSGFLTKSTNNYDVLKDIVQGDRQKFYNSPGLQYP